MVGCGKQRQDRGQGMGQKLEENLTKLILPQKPSFASVFKKKLTYFIICLNILQET